MDGQLTSWRALPALHQPEYVDSTQLLSVLETLRSFPPLVFAGEADNLRELIGKAGKGEAFVLQGGDCAESFNDAVADRIRSKIRTILQMAVVLTYGASVPVVKIGRMAGQYAKPRTRPYETIGDLTLPSYMGDAVNSFEFAPEARTPDPQRLIEAYHRSATTLNLVRAFTTGGLADLNKVHEWNKGFSSNPAYKRYNQLAHEIDKAMRFMRATGVDSHALRTVDFYSSHEALLLDYKSALTRTDTRTGLFYNTSAHFLWIGDRTRSSQEAHVELLAQVQNPIGVKLGPNATPGEVIALMDKLNPEGVAGRLSFIIRMGVSHIARQLPAIIEAVQADGRPVTWISDPMHGNTIVASNGYKTRNMVDIVQELREFFRIHRDLGSVPGGIHIELTGDDVTEVLGGTEAILETTLGQRYTTLVDPRLNHQQALEIAFLVSEMLSDS